ncbi:hypothetical protein [Helicobacter sp. 23-1045]
MRCFGTKFRSMDAQVLFRSFRAKTTQSTTAITSIVFCARFPLFCHSERSEESKTRESMSKFTLLQYGFALYPHPLKTATKNAIITK